MTRPRIWIPEAPHLALRRYNEIAITTSCVRVEGWFDLEMLHAATGLVAFKSRFRNTIVDNAMNAFATTSPATMMQYVAVGTSGTAPATNQAALLAHVDRTNATGGFADGGGWATDNQTYSYYRITRVFTTAQAIGNLAEVGVFDTSNVSTSTMLCRQQIKDGAGNPTVLAKTSEYELRVTYELRYYPVLADTTYSATINGASQTITTRPRFLGSPFGDWSITNRPFISAGATDFQLSAGGLVGVQAGPSSPVNASTLVLQSYTTGNFYREVQVEWNGSVANTTTYLSIHAGRSGCPYQHLLTTGVSKTNVQKYVLLMRGIWTRL